MTVFYVITKFLTFPGAITKSLFEHIMCKILKLPVEDTRCLRTDEMCGHIEHELVERPAASFWYCFIPGLLNFFLGLNLSIFAIINIFVLGNYTGFIENNSLLSSIFSSAMTNNTVLVGTMNFLLPCFFLWLGFSMLVNLAPLPEDALMMKEQFKNLNTFCKVIFAPGYFVMRIGAALESRGLTFILFAVICAVLAIL
ncbi:MAG TPA: hypothetical protein DDY98_05520 [Ruminococcaceae bacterium]|nr:hypothetical protein [Oscillospiraceae bacterium]